LQEVFCYLIFVKGIETLRIFLVRNELLINWFFVLSNKKGNYVLELRREYDPSCSS
jgi:hypothetical protein